MLSTGASILYFSRGRGRGHAIPDIAIASELPKFINGLSVRFVSYSTGAEVFKTAGQPCIEMALPEANGFLPTLLLATTVIAEKKPNLVVSHEEFAALPAAKLIGVPSIFVNDWFPPSRSIMADALGFADSIVFLEKPGIFAIPGSVRIQPRFVGPMVRSMTYTLEERTRARAELGLRSASLVIAVIPGAWATEERAPIADLVISAFRCLNVDDRALLWLTSRDDNAVLDRSIGVKGVTVIRDCDVVERIIVASDLVITKGNRGTIMDAASLGVPSLSLSYGLNPVDEALVARIRSNLALNARAVDSELLAQYIQQIVATPISERERPLGLHTVGFSIPENVHYLDQ